MTADRILFGANVNGKIRTVQVEASDLPQWAIAWTDGVTQGGEPDHEDLDAIEAHVMNIEYLYDIFYEGATDEDINANLVDITVEVL